MGNYCFDSLPVRLLAYGGASASSDSATGSGGRTSSNSSSGSNNPSTIPAINSITTCNGAIGISDANTINTGTTTTATITTIATNVNVTTTNVYEIGVTPRQYTTNTQSPTSLTTTRRPTSTRTTRMPEDFVARRVNPSLIFQSNIARSSLCPVEDELFSTVATTLCQHNRAGASPLSNILPVSNIPF